MNKRTRTLLLVLVLLAAAAVLSGCALPRGEIDMNNPPGWWEGIIVYPLAKLLIALNNVIKGIGVPGSWGWAIIVFTLLIKVVTLPLTLRQLRVTKAQQELQPQLRELQEKYGKDRQKLAEEQMKMYKEAGVSPMGGCLPLLIQMPVLWGLYQALYVLANPSVNQLLGARFFWVPDLARPALEEGTSWLGKAYAAKDWGTLAAYISLPLLMLLTQFALQKMSQPSKAASGGQKDPQTAMMGQMMFIMPLMFGWITLGLPSGLTLYWTVSNILGIVQQYFVAGWGGLVDWLAFLKKREPASVALSVSSAVGGSSAMELADKPLKRRNRRRK